MHFSYKNIDVANSAIKNQIIKTPLISSDYINKQLNSKIFFKLENLQNTGSFKLRGASYKISKLTDENKKNGVVAYSSGNHAQAVAYASLQQNISCKIIMPKNAPKIKIENTKKYKAEVILTHMPDEHLESSTATYDNILKYLEDYFNKLIKHACLCGIDRKDIIIDPGICFGKSGNDNIKILKNMKYLASVFTRLCIGVSNKRFSSEIFDNINDDEMHIAALTVSTLATCSQVEFLRVHNVEANRDAVEIAWKTINS